MSLGKASSLMILRQFSHVLLSVIWWGLTLCDLATQYGDIHDRNGSTLAQVKAYYLMAPRLNQCWLLSGEVLWHSPVSNFMMSAQATTPYNDFEIYLFFTVTSPRGQWVKHNSYWLVIPSSVSHLITRVIVSVGPLTLSPTPFHMTLAACNGIFN